MKASPRLMASLWRCLRLAERNHDAILRQVFIRLIRKYGG